MNPKSNDGWDDEAAVTVLSRCPMSVASSNGSGISSISLRMLRSYAVMEGASRCSSLAGVNKQGVYKLNLPVV